MEGVDLSLGRSFFGVDRCVVIEGFIVEVDEICGGAFSPDGAVSGIVPYLPTFEACVSGGAGCSLSNTILRCSSLAPPLIGGPSAAEVHRYRPIVKG